MKFSSSFSAIVVASVATAHLSSAAPISTRDIVQGASQGVSQQGSGGPVSQKNSSEQKSIQGVKVTKDDSFFVPSHAHSQAAPPAAAAPASEILGSDSHGNLYSRQLMGLLGDQGAKQQASADGRGGNSLQEQLNKPVLSGSGNSLTAGGPTSATNDGQGGSIEQGLKQVQDLGGLLSKRLLGAQGGKQGASADGYGGNSLQGQLNKPVLSGAGNSLTAGGPQASQNDGTGGQIQQSLEQIESLGGLVRKELLGAQGGKQGASANGYGGNSGQLQSNVPVLSGHGNSLTAGGPQYAQNNGQGGSITQTLDQVQSLGGLVRRQAFAEGHQLGSANGYGGHSLQSQDNAPVISGYGNSVTAGGPQYSQNNGNGGSVKQSLAESLGQRQLEALGLQDGRADGYGGQSVQYQSNRPVVSGYGNSVTTGGPQGATNNGQGGTIDQGLKQLFARGYQGLGQGVVQSIHQYGSAEAKGGNAYISGADGPTSVNTSATGGAVNQYASGQQSGAQSATQGYQQDHIDYFGSGYFRRELQSAGQDVDQGLEQYGNAAAHGGSAYIAGSRGPTHVNTGAQGGVVTQNAQADQQSQQSGTQGAADGFYNYFSARDLQSLGQSTAQKTQQAGAADAAGGPAAIAGSNGFTDVDTSSHGGAVAQNATSNQLSDQKAGQSDERIFYKAFYPRTDTDVSLSQGNAQNVYTNAESNAHSTASNAAELKHAGAWSHDPTSFDAADASAKTDDISQIVGAQQNNTQTAEQHVKRSIPSFGALQNANADARGGDSLDFQHNGKVVEGNGINSVQGGPQTSNGSAQGGRLSQLLNF